MDPWGGGVGPPPPHYPPPPYGMMPQYGGVNMNMAMYGDVEEKPKKKKKSKEKKKSKKKERKEMVPDVGAYMKLLEDVAGWNELKKENLIVNTFAMLGEEKKDEIRAALAVKPEKRNPNGPMIPKTKRKTNFMGTVNTTERYECRSAKVSEGSYLFAIREEWGFFSLYKVGKPTTAERVLSPFISSSSKNYPTWEELIEDQPVFTLVLLEISELSYSKVEFVVRVSTMNSDRPLKLKFPPKDYPAAMTAIKNCHMNSRPFGATPHPGLGTYYVDGEEFFPSLAKHIVMAKREIMLAAWWLSPYIYLNRKEGATSVDQSARLDNLLQRKAFEGVKIYILLYQEVGRAVALTSVHTKAYLESLHPNIKVVRHRGPLQFTHHQKFTVIDWEVLFVGGLDPCYGRYDFHSHPLFDNGEGVEAFPGLDYRNPVLLGDDANAQTKAPFVSTLNKSQSHRLPWHDLHLKLQGRLAYVVGLNFVQRWHHHVKRTTEKNLFITPDVSVLYDKKRLQSIEEDKAMVRCTVCRSLGLWSGNPGPPEKSIHNKYLELINGSNNFIYVENQYFISSLYGPEISNQVAQALVNRIVKAHKEQLSFRVFLLIQPHGEGDPVADQFIRSLLYFQNQTLLRMNAALVKQLGSQDTVDKFLFVGSLQQHAMSPENKPVYSSIYIHSKFIIADDVRFILGSANINDRSFLGDRDSELAVLVDGGASSALIKDYRMRMWCEHLGCTSDQVDNPTSNETWNLIRTTAERNAHLYEKVFPTVPSSSVTTLEEAQRLQARPPNDDTPLKSITGHLVTYPMSWLSSAPPTMIAQAAGTMAAGMFE